MRVVSILRRMISAADLLDRRMAYRATENGNAASFKKMCI